MLLRDFSGYAFIRVRPQKTIQFHCLVICVLVY